MTTNRIILGAVLGMLVTGLAVYKLAAPKSGAPSTPSPAIAAPTETAALPAERPSENTAGPLDGGPPDPNKVAELEREVERLRELLDGGAATDASAHGSSRDATPASKAHVPAGETICSRPMTASAWQGMLDTVPAIRQLPPDKQQLIRDGSPYCRCFANPQGQRACQDWCVIKGQRRGTCSNGYCACSF
jgi:hypothetical protein